MMAVDLPWPSADLSPNARLHWAAKAKAVKDARRDAVIAARAAGIKRACARRASVTLTFSPPDNRRRDTDNMLSSCKGYCDGIADVIGIDDCLWDIAIRRAEPVKGGNVKFEIEVKHD